MVPVIIATPRSVALVWTYPHRWGPFEVGEVLGDGQEPIMGDVESSELGGIFRLLVLPVGLFWPLPWLFFYLDRPLAAGLPLWAVIMTVSEAARMLSSSVENLSARQYNSSIVVGGSRDKDWKNGVVGPKLLLKFCNIASIL